MAQVTSSNGLNMYVDSEEYNFGEVSGNAIVKFEFPFKRGAEEIEYIERNCGCSSAFYEDGKIKGELNISQANGSQEYGEGETPIEKFIFVWLNDGHRRYLGDDKKQRQMNPLKSWFRLAIRGKVVK